MEENLTINEIMSPFFNKRYYPILFCILYTGINDNIYSSSNLVIKK